MVHDGACAMEGVEHVTAYCVGVCVCTCCVRGCIERGGGSLGPGPTAPLLHPLLETCGSDISQKIICSVMGFLYGFSFEKNEL